MSADAIENVKVGDVFYSSWGYDQTNVDFYEVVGLTPSGKSVRVVQAPKRLSDDGRGVVPVKLPMWLASDVLTKRLSFYSDKPCFTLTSYSAAYLWDGTPKFDTTALGYAGH